jgi:DNA (cytosine-5)-methyltransferase 1
MLHAGSGCRWSYWLPPVRPYGIHHTGGDWTSWAALRRVGQVIGNLSVVPTHPEPVTADEAEIVDLFAGPGGLDVAARDLGKRVIGIEHDSSACATRKEARLATIHDDVRKYGPQQFPAATILVGGPPCQTYSVAGNGIGRNNLESVLAFAERIAKGEDVEDEFGQLDERTGLVLEPLRWALKAIDIDRPFHAIVLEQVPAVMPVWKAVGSILEDRGYKTDRAVLHAERFGVPQSRRRAILVARWGAEVALPRESHRAYHKGRRRDEGDASLKPWVSMAEALGRADGFEVISNYGTGGDPANRGRRRSWEPAATVTSKVFRNKVVSLNGTVSRFSEEEAGVLQTFPRNYPWRGRDIAKQIGNAIPPLLARRVLERVLATVPPAEKDIPLQVRPHNYEKAS